MGSWERDKTKPAIWPRRWGNMSLYTRQGSADDDAAEAITPWWRDVNCVGVRSSSDDCPRMVASRNVTSRKLDVPAMLVVVKHRESRR